MLYTTLGDAGWVQVTVRGRSGFERDPGNWRKSELTHGVAAAETEEVMLNGPICRVDTVHSGPEQRYVAPGVTSEGRRLFVAFTIRGSRVRIISARPMSKKERVLHEEAQMAHRRAGRRPLADP